MIEVDTTYSWQMLSRVGARGLCASVPASLSRTQSKFGLAWANKMSAGKPFSLPSSDAQAACCFTQQAQVCNFHLNQQLSLSCIRCASSHPDSRSADSFNHIHADMSISTPVPALFVSEKHTFAAGLSIN